MVDGDPVSGKSIRFWRNKLRTKLINMVSYPDSDKKRLRFSSLSGYHDFFVGFS